MSSRDFGRHAQRLDLIDAGVGGVERARYLVEADFAGEPVLEFVAKGRQVHPAWLGLRNRRSGRNRYEAHRELLFPRAPGKPWVELIMHQSGRHFLQIPGPTNVPDRILRAMARPTIDHRGPEFAALGREVLEGVREVFQTSGPVVIFPASGTGAWEAALVNTLSPGDKVLAFEIGEFAKLWYEAGAAAGIRGGCGGGRLEKRRRSGHGGSQAG